jgi:hypothetical protein
MSHVQVQCVGTFIVGSGARALAHICMPITRRLRLFYTLRRRLNVTTSMSHVLPVLREHSGAFSDCCARPELNRKFILQPHADG